MRILSEQALGTALAGVPASDPGGPRIVASGNHALPRTLLRVLDEAVPAFRLFVLNAPHGVPDRDGVVLETPFIGPGMRGSPRLDYLPARLSLVPELFRRGRPPDVVALHVSAPRDGTVSMGTEVNLLPAAIEAVRQRGGLVVAQVNPRMPYTYGDGVLALDEVDLAVEVSEELDEPPLRQPSDVSRAIGERVAALVPEAATLQLGIGGVPDAVLAALTERRGLRVWSEMLSDGLLGLERAGSLDVECPVVCTFLFGQRDLYDYVDGNQRIRVLRTERVNAPSVIARQPGMTSINTALQVDLFAQANATRRPDRPGVAFSGIGGQTDFVVGALHAGGVAVIALASRHPKAGVSTVVPVVDVATSAQHTHIVSEQGVAPVFGCSEREQARAVVDQVAHPDARDGLREAAGRLGVRL